tara:strand:- start:13832 stop:14821 length:990 start_codon:yes stop_codon:yes gene_type:complete
MNSLLPEGQTIVALSGGVGGAKLALGLSHVLNAAQLKIIVNTADDFTHLGLRISPDLDTLAYTLADLANKETGWGRAGESWNFMTALSGLGGETWFQLGDKDLALHVERTRQLTIGKSLTQVTCDLAAKLGIGPGILPMSDDPVQTTVLTPDGDLSFQHYFVRDRCEPPVTGFRFEGIANAHPTAAVVEALASATLQGIVLCPSNPFVSIDPILAVPGLKAMMRKSAAPIIAISPIVGGAALKGPAAKMMRELGIPSTSEAVADHYRGFIDGFIVDEADKSAAAAIEASGLPVRVMNTIMHSLQDRIDLARATVAFVQDLDGSKERKAS